MKLEVAKQLVGSVVENCGTSLSKAGYKRMLEELAKLEAENQQLQKASSNKKYTASQASPKSCQHNWISAVNGVVKNGEYCTKGHAVRA